MRVEIRKGDSWKHIAQGGVGRVVLVKPETGRVILVMQSGKRVRTRMANLREKWVRA